MDKTGFFIYDDEFNFNLVGFSYSVNTHGKTLTALAGASLGRTVGYYGVASYSDANDEVVTTYDASRGDMTWMVDKVGDTYYIKFGQTGAVFGYDAGHGSIHTEAYNHTIGTQKTSTYSVPDAETAFHTYAIEWTTEKIDFFVDDVKYFSFTNEHTGYKVWPFDQPFHFILNLAVGGDWGGAEGVDPNIWPQQMVVDYARVYQYITKDQIVVDGPTNVTANATGLVFKTQNIVGATYHWTVPDGATIVSGDGSNQIVVNWGTSAGDVQVQITHPDAGGNYSKGVAVITAPTGDKYTIVDFSSSGTEGWAPYSNGTNIITLSKQDTLLLIKYNIVDPSVNPHDYRNVDDGFKTC